MAVAKVGRSSWPLIPRRPVASDHQGRELLRVCADPGERAKRLADPLDHRPCLVSWRPHFNKPWLHYKVYSLTKWFPYTMIFNPVCTSELPREIFKILMPRPHPKSIKSDSLGVAPWLQYSLNRPWWSQCVAKIENHCIEVIVLITSPACPCLYIPLTQAVIFSFIFSLFYFVLSVDNSIILH